MKADLKHLASGAPDLGHQGSPEAGGLRSEALVPNQFQPRWICAPTSYSRCVDSCRLSNGKKKGKGNAKNGNRYLAWAFVEAANFAVRFSTPIRAYYERKKQRTKTVVAIKTVAHKLARASYYMLRDEVEFDVNIAFGIWLRAAQCRW